MMASSAVANNKQTLNDECELKQLDKKCATICLTTTDNNIDGISNGYGKGSPAAAAAAVSKDCGNVDSKDSNDDKTHITCDVKLLPNNNSNSHNKRAVKRLSTVCLPNNNESDACYDIIMKRRRKIRRKICTNAALLLAIMFLASILSFYCISKDGVCGCKFFSSH